MAGDVNIAAYIRSLEARIAALERGERPVAGSSWPGFDDSGAPANVAAAAADGVGASPSRNDHVHTIGSGVVTSTMLADGAALAEILDDDGAGSLLDADKLDGQEGAYYLAAGSYTAADVLAKLLTVDGAASGLDADLLDGLSSLAFVKADGTVVLTGDWDIGASRKVSGDKLAARSASGLRLEDDGGNLGVFVEDGGQVGVGTNTPNTRLTVQEVTDGLISGFIVDDGGDTVAFYLYGYTADYATAYLQDAILFYASASTSILQLTAAKSGAQIRFNTDGYGADSTERMRIEAAGVGISAGGGTFAPQAPLHIYNGVGGFMVVSKTAIGTTAQVFIPNGAGDVTKQIRVNMFTDNGTGAGGFSGFTLVVGGATTQNVTIGSDTYQYRINADGSFDIRRTAGSNAGSCHGNLQWW